MNFNAGFIHFDENISDCGPFYVLPARPCDEWRLFVPRVLGLLPLSVAIRDVNGGAWREIGTVENPPSIVPPAGFATVLIAFNSGVPPQISGDFLTFTFENAPGCAPFGGFGFTITEADALQTIEDVRDFFVQFINLNAGYGTAFVRNDGLVEWVINQSDFLTQFDKNVCETGFRFCGQVCGGFSIEIIAGPRCEPLTPCPEPEYSALYLSFPQCLPFGRYELAILDGGNPILYGNPLNVGDGEHTLMVRYRNFQDFAGFPYSLDPSFYQQIRLGLTLDKPFFSKKQAVSYASSGKARKLYARLRSIFALETDYFDAQTHAAFTFALEHDYIAFFDEKENRFVEFVHEENYSVDWPETRPAFPFAKAKTRLTRADFDAVNSFC